MKLKPPRWPRLLPSVVVLPLATLGPVGRRLPAPGTWGSVAGLLYFLVFFAPQSITPDTREWLVILHTLLGCAVAVYLAVGICGEAEVRMGRTDPGEVVLDEVVAMPLCFLGLPWLAGPLPIWGILLLGLGLFRVFDIAKPFGIKKLQGLPGGWGVVLDDTAAALATCATLHIARVAWRIHAGA
jgi:phosphatidylglycerophosphatase A